MILLSFFILLFLALVLVLRAELSPMDKGRLALFIGVLAVAGMVFALLFATINAIDQHEKEVDRLLIQLESELNQGR